MQIIKTKVYNFSELDEKARQKAIEWFLSDYPAYDWWDSMYEDAKNIDLQITESDTYQGEIKGNFITSPLECAEKILGEHGEKCETYQTAKNYLKRLKELGEPVEEECSGDYDYDAYKKYNEEKTELDEEFLEDILNDYLNLLKKEEKYLTSEEHAEETIKDNEYTFTKDGTRFG